MRVIGGTLRGRRLKTPEGTHTRPTTDRVREAIASVLSSRCVIANAQVLELYAGSGALSFEMLSRGAAWSVCVENNKYASRIIAENAETLGIKKEVSIVSCDLGQQARSVERIRTALNQRGGGAFSLVFMDPPYEAFLKAIEILPTLFDSKIIDTQTTIVLEHGKKPAPTLPPWFLLEAQYTYGDTCVKLGFMRPTETL